MPKSTPRRWTRAITALATEFGFNNLRVEKSGSNHLKLFTGKRLLMSASSTPGDPAVMHAYRRQLRKAAMIRTAAAAAAVAALLLGGAAAQAQSFVNVYPVQDMPPAVLYSVPGEETITYDPAEEMRKAAVRAATNYRDPNSHDVCPRPWRMTERDGCRR